MRARVGPLALNLTLSLLALLFALWIGESILGALHAADPYTGFLQRDKQLRLRSHRLAKKNPFGFTDRERHEQKGEGVYRIAVLGDSYIWGSGLPYEEVWSHKLERMLDARYENLEVLSWGRNGWSTLDELRFLKEHGHRFNVDLLILGLVENDPDVGRHEMINADARTGWIREKLRAAHRIFPRVTTLVGERYLDFVLGTPTEEYARWLSELYTPENLEAYAEVLRAFAAACTSFNIELLVVSTPSNQFDGRSAEIFQALAARIEAAEIEYLDLLPRAQERFGDYPVLLLQASPVNRHPGPVLTQFFADEVRAHLEANPRLSKTWRVRTSPSAASVEEPEARWGGSTVCYLRPRGSEV